jgi:hypothetical protein
MLIKGARSGGSRRELPSITKSLAGVVACPRPDRGVHSAGEFHVVLFLNSGAPLVLEDDILKNYVA